MTRTMVTGSVRAGALLRVRNGRYLRPDEDPRVVEAGRHGGRLDCVSLLEVLGVFVRVHGGLHLQFEPGTTRLPARAPRVTAHWRTTSRLRCHLTADLLDALVQAVRCQRPRDAVATLDSAWHCGLIDESDVAEIFRRLPLRFQTLKSLLDPRAESGAETLVRLLARALGCTIDVQRVIPTVGRVDLVLDGWLIVECDSRAFHEGWAAQLRDRRRDLAASAVGYTTIRPVAEDIFAHPESLMATLKETIAHGPPTARRRNSTDSRGEPSPRR
jgi:very-short-patch-repair endonuclease